MLLPVAVTKRVSLISMREPIDCVTFGAGAVPARTAMSAGVDEPSWPLMSVEMGMMVMTPFSGALPGTLMAACIVAALLGGEKLTTTVVSIGVGQLGSLVAWKPSFVTPRVLSALSETCRFAPLVALSPRTGLRNSTVGPFTIFTL